MYIILYITIYQKQVALAHEFRDVAACRRYTVPVPLLGKLAEAVIVKVNERIELIN